MRKSTISGLLDSIKQVVIDLLFDDEEDEDASADKDRDSDNREGD